MKTSYADYKKFWKEEDCNAFGNKTFGLRLGCTIDKLSTTKNKTCYRFYLIKNSFKNKYQNVEIDFDDIMHDSWRTQVQSLCDRVVCSFWVLLIWLYQSKNHFHLALET
jgi:hypothetical protein